MSDTRHQCTQCTATFRRQEHLERHRLCHAGDRPFRCTFCSESFKRRDVLQRHWRSCKSRLNAGAEIPRVPVAPRPKKRRACDRCARLKKACSLGSPCNACRGREVECTYNHSQRPSVPDPEASIPTLDQPDLFFSPDLALCSPSNTFRSLVDNEYVLAFAQRTPASFDPAFDLQLSTCSSLTFGKFRFLDQFTSVTGFVNSFECMRVTEIKDLARIVTTTVSDGNSIVGTQETASELVSLDFVPLAFLHTEETNSLEWLAELSPEMCLNCTEWLLDPLAAVTNTLVCALKHVTENPGPGSSITLTWSPFIEKVSVQFFSPQNIRRYLVYFWSFWYPNCPIIHKPTFDVHKTPHPLLLSMLLIGASFAPEEAVNQNARLWFNSAEELVFADEHFRRAVFVGDGMEEDLHQRWNALKAVQAAYLICLLQNWDGDDHSKRRIRRVRFSMVTAIARELGFARGSRHEPNAEDGDWARFVLKEEFNRTLLYIFLLDTAFVIFHNAPPKVTISELNIDPACPERCFQASTATECFLHLSDRANTAPIATCSIAGLVSKISHGELPTADRDYIAQLGTLNLFIIVSAFHTLLFHARNTLAPQAAILPIQQGLHNWKLIWSHHEALDHNHNPHLGLPLLRECWKRTGFMEYAPEYWTLAQAIISVQETQTIANTDPSSATGSPLSRFDENDMKQLNRFIKWVRNAGILHV